MAYKPNNDTQISCDVLIIGGGAAGLWAANRIKQLSPETDVLIVDKGAKDWGGLMSMSGGDFDAVAPGDSLDDWIADLVYYWDGLCEQDVLEKLFSLSYDRMEDYKRFGCQYFTDDDGSLHKVPQRGLDHVCLYPAKFKGTGGEDMAKGLVKDTIARGVRRIWKTVVTDLIKDHGRVCGAVGFDVQNGDFYRFSFKAALVATGNTGWKPSYSQNTATGEWVDMVWRAGTEMRNYEFVKVWNQPKLFSWEGQTTLFPLGARFINALGEPFMDKYSPVLGANTDPHYMTRAMAIEIREGRGPIYFDMSQIKPEDKILIVPQTGSQLMHHNKLKALGIDFFTQNTEWIPQLQDSVGGIVTDMGGATSVPGLFAAGRCRSIDPGVYIGGFALSTTATGGYVAGESIVEYLRSGAGEGLVPAADEQEFNKERLYAPLDSGGLSPKLVLREIQSVVFPYDVCILKTEKSLKNALGRLQAVNADLLPRMGAPDPHTLMKLLEVRGISLVSELYIRSSLERTDSRAGHWREDFPQRDDENWLCWLHVSGGDAGGFEYKKVPVPVEKYKHPIERFYTDNFKF